jgi:CheY-like chemotaxis protein
MMMSSARRWPNLSAVTMSKYFAAATGAEGLAAVQEGRFDCAIVDLMLPDIEWSELIAKIKQESGFPELPVIVHTGKDLSKKETARNQETRRNRYRQGRRVGRTPCR